jgi:hypothetical protein
MEFSFNVDFTIKAEDCIYELEFDIPAEPVKLLFCSLLFGLSE